MIQVQTAMHIKSFTFNIVNITLLFLAVLLLSSLGLILLPLIPCMKLLACCLRDRLWRRVLAQRHSSPCYKGEKLKT